MYGVRLYFSVHLLIPRNAIKSYGKLLDRFIHNNAGYKMRVEKHRRTWHTCICRFTVSVMRALNYMVCDDGPQETWNTSHLWFSDMTSQKRCTLVMCPCHRSHYSTVCVHSPHSAWKWMYLLRCTELEGSVRREHWEIVDKPAEQDFFAYMLNNSLNLWDAWSNTNARNCTDSFRFVCLNSFLAYHKRADYILGYYEMRNFVQHG